MSELDAMSVHKLQERVEELERDLALLKTAVRWAPSSRYWSDELERLGGPDARAGINALEAEYSLSIETARRAGDEVAALKQQLAMYESAVQPVIEGGPCVIDSSGWALVPIEPTSEMKIAGDHAGWWCGDKYRAMVAAAPKPETER